MPWGNYSRYSGKPSPIRVTNIVADDGELALGLPVGKHKGKPLAQVPTPYLFWVMRQDLDADTMAVLQTEVMRRKREEPERLERARELEAESPAQEPVLVVIDREMPLHDLIEKRVKDLLAVAAEPGELSAALRVAITWAISKKDLVSPAWGSNLSNTLKEPTRRVGRRPTTTRRIASED